MSLILLIVFGSINGMIAKSKGYNPLVWFLAAGLLGLILIVFLPNTYNEKYEPEEAEILRKRGNITAVGILTFAVIFILGAILIIR